MAADSSPARTRTRWTRCTRDLDERSGTHHSVRVGPGIRINTWFERDKDVACHERDWSHRLRGGANGQSANNETDGDESFADAHEAALLLSHDCFSGGIKLRCKCAASPAGPPKLCETGPGPFSAVLPDENRGSRNALCQALDPQNQHLCAEQLVHNRRKDLDGCRRGGEAPGRSAAAFHRKGQARNASMFVTRPPA